MADLMVFNLIFMASYLDFRPLIMGKNNDGYIVASESAAIANAAAEMGSRMCKFWEYLNSCALLFWRGHENKG